MPRIEFWYEFGSTYSYPAAMRIDDVAISYGCDVGWRVFALGAIFKAEGLPADSPFNWQSTKGRYMWRDMERICAAAGLPFARPDPFPQNGILASRVALIGHDAGWGIAFSKAVYTAEFARGEQIADPAVIAAILDALGIDSASILRAARHPDNKARLKAATDEAHGLGIFGAPSFVTADKELFWGNDWMEEAFEWALERTT